MMLKEKSSPWARLKYLYVLPLAAIAVTAFARPEVSETVKEISTVKVNDLSAIVETKVAESVPEDSVVFEIVERMPEFPGGIKACMDYLQKNMRYPEAAKKAGMQGCVTVRFVVDKEGNIKEPKVLRSVDKEFDAEAIRLVKTMPKWNPGKQRDVPVAVKFTLPVKFQLDGDSAAQAVEETAEEIGSPLYIVNGKEIDEAIISALDHSKIAEVTIWKDEKAVELYGEKAKNGVMVITLKGASSDNNADKDGSLQGTVIKIQNAPAQDDFKMEGKVVDEKGGPVIGAAVLIEGTNRGTVTDLDGRFILPVSKNEVIVVSFIDMQTVKVKAAPKVTITMKAE